MNNPNNGGDTSSDELTTPTNTAASDSIEGHRLGSGGTRKKRYIVATKRGSLAQQSGLKPLTSFELKRHLARFENVQIKHTIDRNTGVSPQSKVPGEAKEVHVVEMDDQAHDDLRSNSPDHVLIEEEQSLGFLDARADSDLHPFRGGSVRDLYQTAVYTFLVLGENDRPLANVEIALKSGFNRGKGTTDTNGRVKIYLDVLPDTGIEFVFAKAKDSYWDFYLKSPTLKTDQPNIIRLKSLTETIPNFPNEYTAGWGERLMGFDGGESKITGKGARVAIIDTGKGIHPLLDHVKAGIDLTNNGDLSTWTNDPEGHGTHVCGVITASGNGNSFTGISPEADVLIIKVFPGGTTSSLVEALDICIAEKIEVVNMSLGTPKISLVVEQKIEEAVMAGVALVVAAGNSGGPVQFPASSPNALAVSAIGSTQTLQPNTFDASQVTRDLTMAHGIFSPLFSCHGPEVNVTAPGVAIISTGPNGTFFPDSGTSMAAPHVTGLAAILIAQHPAFSTRFANRDYHRVFALYDLLRKISVPLELGRERTGFGMPQLNAIIQELLVEEDQQASETT